ncbi:MAG: hypothetical protein KTR27_21015 [Leptolyngbyaceae cyanobacterium MAG.088]|nr:hypothetical protein [Leptolyngbyaceae cyanobacterium MAG.088]
MQTYNLSFLSETILRKTKRLLRHSVDDLSRLLATNPRHLPITNEKELRVIGLRRTGNHAVIEWIKAQQPGNIEHVNNVEARSNPYRYKFEHLIDYHPKHKKWAYQHYLPLSKGDFRHLDCLICSYEDQTLDSICDPFFERLHDIYVGKSRQRFDLLIVRDPFNLFASRLKSNMIDIKSPRLTAVDLWIQYAKEFLGDSQYLKQNKILVNYNQFVTDINYRKKLSLALGLKFSDAGIKRVASLGGGSSFDSQGMDGRGNEMRVLERWQHFEQDTTFRNIFQNPALLHYSKKIFGEIPGTAKLL